MLTHDGIAGLVGLFRHLQLCHSKLCEYLATFLADPQVTLGKADTDKGRS